LTDKKEQAIKRGLRAQALIDDPVLGEALDVLKDEGIEAMLHCAHIDLVDRRAYVSVIDEFRRKLEIFIANGKIAERELT
jgi:hypothetical protein